MPVATPAPVYFRGRSSVAGLRFPRALAAIRPAPGRSDGWRLKVIQAGSTGARAQDVPLTKSGQLSGART